MAGVGGQSVVSCDEIGSNGRPVHSKCWCTTADHSKMLNCIVQRKKNVAFFISMIVYGTYRGLHGKQDVKIEALRTIVPKRDIDAVVPQEWYCGRC